MPRSRAFPVVLAAVLLAGCGRSVAVAPLPITSEATREACGRVIEALPARLSVGRAWPVQPDPRSTMAWGSPPVVLRCGEQVPAPTATDQLLEVNGVTWLVQPLTNGEEYTAVGRVPGVVVTVPSDYSPTSAVLVEVGPAVAGHTRQSG